MGFIPEGRSITILFSMAKGLIYYTGKKINQEFHLALKFSNTPRRIWYMNRLPILVLPIILGSKI